jgi:translation elongation factor EF-1alpha
MKWFNNIFVEDAICRIQVPNRPTDKLLRILITNKYLVRGVGLVIGGYVATGTITEKTQLLIGP